MFAVAAILSLFPFLSPLPWSSSLFKGAGDTSVFEWSLRLCFAFYEPWMCLGNIKKKNSEYQLRASLCRIVTHPLLEFGSRASPAPRHGLAGAMKPLKNVSLL